MSSYFWKLLIGISERYLGKEKYKVEGIYVTLEIGLKLIIYWSNQVGCVVENFKIHIYPQDMYNLLEKTKLK